MTSAAQDLRAMAILLEDLASYAPVAFEEYYVPLNLLEEAGRLSVIARKLADELERKGHSGVHHEQAPYEAEGDDHG